MLFNRNCVACFKREMFLLDNTLAVEDIPTAIPKKITVKNPFDNIMAFVFWLALEEIAF